VPKLHFTYATIQEPRAARLIITASHNSYIYNGIKFVDKDGQPANENVTIDLEKYINRIKITDVLRKSYQSAYNKGLIRTFNYQHQFIMFIKKQLNIDILRSAHLKVLYDPMYGTGGTPILNLLVDIQSQFKMIHENADPLFGGRVPTPSQITLWKLRAMMKEEEYDIGMATDGDGDRIAVIDNKGHYVHDNEIIAILYYYLLEYKKLTGSVVRNISTTHLLDKIANAYGERCIETPVGFKYIAEEMLLNDAIIGGESSGGITIRDYLLEKDGILAGGLILEMLAKTGKRLTDIRTEIAQKFGRFSFVEDNLMFPRNRRDMLIEFLNHRYIPDEIKGT